MSTPATGLLALADELYAADPGGFTERRNRMVREHQADRELAARIKGLRKPTVAAWAVNLLVRREADQIAQVLALGASLREAAAALDGEELRALTRQRRQLTTALTTTARGLARERGIRLTPAVADQVEGVLNAAMLDRVAADAVRSGLLVAAFAGTGVDEVDLEAALALPEAVGSTPKPVERPRPELSVVQPDEADRRAELTERVVELEEAVAEAQALLEEADGTRRELDARRLQLQGEIDELRRRVAALEDEVEAVDVDIETADAEVGRAQETLDTARDDLDRAAQELRGLG